MRRVTRVLPLLFVLMVAASPARAADTWLEVKSPNFTVVANTGERKARNIAWQFEQIRSALAKGWPWANVDLDQPVTTLAVKDNDAMRLIVPEYYRRNGDGVASVFATAPDGYHVALRADVQEEGQGLQSYRYAFWNYCRIVLGRSFRYGLPEWMAEGMSDLLSNTIVTDKEVQFGRPLPDLVTQVRQYPLLPVAQLIATKRLGNNATDDQRRSYDAQSWALVQFLLFGDPEHRLNTIVQLVIDGASSEDAIKKTFGSLENLDTAYRLYVQQGVFRYGRLATNAEVSGEKYPVRNLTAAEGDGARAAFVATTGDGALARKFLDQARSGGTPPAIVFDTEALLARRDNDAVAERAALEKAVTQGSTNGFTYYRLGEILQEAGGTERANARKQFERAIAINPRFVPSYSRLANLMLQAGDEKGIETLVQAIKLEPNDLNLRLQLAYAFLQLSAWSDAMTIATGAMPLAHDDADRARLQQVIDTATRNRDARTTGPAGTRGAPATRP